MAKKRAETSFAYKPPPTPGAPAPGAPGSDGSQRVEAKIDELIKKQEERFKELTKLIEDLPDVLIEKLREAMTG
jgi:hypothetical protein